MLSRGMFCCSMSLSFASGPSKRHIARGFLSVISLHDATRNTELKELHFTSQVALCQNAPALLIPRPQPSGLARAKVRRATRAVRMARVRRAESPMAKSRVGETWYDLVSKTPDGRELCYAYNIKRGCQVKGCQRIHACRIKGCQGNHPAYQHGAQGGS